MSLQMWCCWRRWSSPGFPHFPASPGSACTNVVKSKEVKFVWLVDCTISNKWNIVLWKISPPLSFHRTRHVQRGYPAWTFKVLSHKLRCQHIMLLKINLRCIKHSSLKLECSCSCRVVISYGPQVVFFGNLEKELLSISMKLKWGKPPIWTKQKRFFFKTLS